MKTTMHFNLNEPIDKRSYYRCLTSDNLTEALNDILSAFENLDKTGAHWSCYKANKGAIKTKDALKIVREIISMQDCFDHRIGLRDE